MIAAGLLVTLLGFLLSLFSLSLTDGATARLGLVLAGCVISLVGIIGMINPAYLRNAIWRK